MSQPNLYTNARRQYLYHNNPASRRSKIRSNQMWHIKNMIKKLEIRIETIKDRIYKYEKDLVELANEKDKNS